MTLSILTQVSDWAIFIGRFHPLLVHLPIGFIVIALFLEIGQRTGKLAVTENTKSFVLLAAAIGATLSCVVGLMLASEGGYAEDALSSHKWQGIGVALFSWIAWLVSSGTGSRLLRFGWISALYVPSFFFAVILMFSTGHIGGGLTHGEDYLTQHMPNSLRSLAGLPPRDENFDSGEIKPLDNVNEAVVYTDIVQPILNARCVQCHGKSKQKGDLRLDSYAALEKGGEGGSVLMPGNATESSLVKVCLLPMEDDMHMPPKGKTQLTEAQIGLISWWIDQGAPKETKVAELDKPEPVSEALKSLGGGTDMDNATVAKRIDLGKLLVAEADKNVIQELRKLNLIVSTVSKDQHIIEVSAINAPGFADTHVPLLQKVAEQIVWLKLGGTAITDRSMKELAGIKHLNKLHLENTAISDEGISALGEVPFLEYLNLIGTKVSDASVQKIAAMKSLKSLYVWKSAISDEGIEQLKKLRPDLTVIGGLTEQDVQEFLSAAKKDSLGKNAKAE